MAGDAAGGAILSVLFAPGQRPDADALEALSVASLAGDAALPIPFSLTARSYDDDGWAELLAMGLAFDCLELAPRRATRHANPGQPLGLDAVPDGELIVLQPGPHLIGGAGLLPVVRVLAGLGLALSTLPGALAVCWGPAGTCMAPDYYKRIVGSWLAGGAFPALGLTMLHRTADGAMESRGLAFMTGQELRFEPAAGLSPQQAGQIAVRLIHLLAENGPLVDTGELTGPAGEVLQAAPDGALVRVWM